MDEVVAAGQNRGAEEAGGLHADACFEGGGEEGGGPARQEGGFNSSGSQALD
jgi:hypothetical protein